MTEEGGEVCNTNAPEVEHGGEATKDGPVVNTDAPEVERGGKAKKGGLVVITDLPEVERGGDATKDGPVVEPLSGRQLLENFRRRKALGLLPSKPDARQRSAVPRSVPAVAILTADRRAKLLAHDAFSYGLEAEAAAPSAQMLELAARREQLEEQFQELEGELGKASAATAEANERRAEVQTDKEIALEEHMALTRKLAEAQARSKELEKEHERLKSALQEHGDDGSEEPPAAEAEAAETPPSEEELANLRSEAAKVARQAALHRTYLLQLEEENRRLREAQKTDAAPHATAGAAA